MLDVLLQLDQRPDFGDTDKMVRVEGGAFMMGSPAGEPCRLPNEEQHQVTLTHDFEIMATEVTEKAFVTLMGYYPPFVKEAGYSPVRAVNWHEAAAYCNGLSNTNGHDACYDCSGTTSNVQCVTAEEYAEGKIYNCPGYRLPTEAEWEYSYRAGTTTAFHNGKNDPNSCAPCAANDATADKIAWYCGNTNVFHPVGTKQPNSWGLHDMAGNVWEWCHDRYQDSLGTLSAVDPWGSPVGTNRVTRGGSIGVVAAHVRAAYRYFHEETGYAQDCGFRCVRGLQP